ncbi:MAG: solute carrier family 23 protein [Leptolyngbyaceae cyanobacterium]
MIPEAEDASTDYSANPAEQIPEPEATVNPADDAADSSRPSEPSEPPLPLFDELEKRISLALTDWFKNSLIPSPQGNGQKAQVVEPSDHEATAQPSESSEAKAEESSESVVETAETSESVSEPSAEMNDAEGEAAPELNEADAEATVPETEPPPEVTEAFEPEASAASEVAPPEAIRETEAETGEVETGASLGPPKTKAAIKALTQSLSDTAVSKQPAVVAAVGRFFNFDALGTNLRTETLAGITTFITMAYILVVNPDILSQAIFVNQSGDLFGQLVVATGISAAIATLTMGVVAKYPIALAPGMGLNAFFAFSVVIGLGIDWRIALAAILIEGLIFIALTLTNVRAHIIKAIPESLKRATAAGIGLFIAYIALSGNPEFGGAGLIIASDATKTTLGDLSQPPTLMALFGILVSSAFLARRVKGALLWGILATALLGWILGITPWPEGIVGLPFWPGNLLGQAFVGMGQIGTVGVANFLAVLFVFLFVDLFDTIGTLSGVGIQAGFIKKSGELPRANQALLADAVGTTAGAVLGTSTVTSYIESASGIAEGGRSGFTAVVTALCFALSIFFIPLLSAIPGYATAPALLMVGVMMMGSVAEIRWSDPAESIPCFLTILLMPLTFSIAEGLAVGFIAYPLIKTFQGKAHEVNAAMWILAVIFLTRFVLMGLGIA